MFKKIIIFAVVLILATVLAYTVLTSLFPLGYREYVEKYSDMYGADRATVYAVIKAESNFEPTAASHKGAVGLMQITSGTGEWCADKMGLNEYTATDLSDPETNINMGVWYLSYLKEETGSTELAVMAYNAGIGRVNKWIEEGKVSASGVDADAIPYPETSKYLKKVRIFTKVYNLLFSLT